MTKEEVISKFPCTLTIKKLMKVNYPDRCNGAIALCSLLGISLKENKHNYDIVINTYVSWGVKSGFIHTNGTFIDITSNKSLTKCKLGDTVTFKISKHEHV